MRRTFLKMLAAGALAPTFGTSVALAQGDTYPSKGPIRLIVPFPPGGGTDSLARAVSERMTVALGQSFIVDNKPGAGGMIGAEAATRAPADGYTLFIGTNSTLVTNKYLYTKMPYDPDQLELVGLIGITPLVLLVNPSVPFKTVPAMVAYAKANPGKLAYASFGAGTTSHLAGEQFKQMAGIDMLHVPYKGAAEALPAIIGGQVQVYFDTIVSGMPHVKSGKLRVLGVTSQRRSAGFSDIPTIAEQGYPGYDIYPWYGMVAPKGTPNEALDKLRTVLAKVLGEKPLVEKLSALGAEVTPMTPTEFADLVRQENVKTENVVKAAKITLQ